MSEAIAPHSRTIRKNVSVVGAAYVVAGVCGLAAQAVLARTLGGSIFGLYVAAVSLVTIVRVIDRLGGTEYLVREAARDPDRLGELVGRVAGLTACTTLVVVAVAVPVSFALGFGRTGIVVVGLLALMAGFDATSNAFRAGLQSIERMEIAAGISIGVTVFSAIGMITAVLIGWGLAGAVALSAIVSAIAVPVSWLALRRHVHVSLQLTTSAVLRVARESLPFAIIGMFAFGTTYIDAVIIRAVHGNHVTGIYGAAYRVVLVLGWIPVIYATAAYRTLSHLAHRSREAFATFVQRSVTWLLLVALPLAAGGALVGERLVVLVFGRTFAPAAHVLHILVWSMPFVFASIFLLDAIMVGERPKIAAKILGVAFFLNAGANLALVPHFGINAAAWVTVATEALVCVGSVYVLAREHPLTRRSFRSVAAGFGAALVMYGVVLPLRHLPLAAPIAAGAAAYVIALGLILWGARTVELRRARVNAPIVQTSPRISAVMPVYNAARYVEEAVASVLAQHESDFELLVVDDGSTDGTASLVAAFADPRISIIHTEHGGLPHAENTGIEHARAAYIVRVDGDDVYEPELFGALLAELDAHPEAAAATCWTRRFAAKQTFDRPPTSPRAIRRGLRRHWVLSNPLMYRTDAVRALGGFRDNWWADDWDLWVRLAARADIRVVPRCLAMIRAHADSTSMAGSRTEVRIRKTQMRWTAMSALGPDVASVFALARAIAAIPVAMVLDRIRPRAARASQEERSPTVSVVVPTYRRVELLAKCLKGLATQQPRADQEIVVYRPDDRETSSFARAWAAVDPARRTAVAVEQPGLVHALAAGTDAAHSDVVAYLDDDAIPRAGWLAEIARGFLDPRVGGVGGPILDHDDGVLVTGSTRTVGRVTWYGRVIGRHRLRTDRYGPVDWLTGSNMAFRRGLAVHDTSLVHTSGGIAIANDMDVCLHVRRAGYRVLFTPWAEVDHYTTSFRDPALGSRVTGEDVATSAANHAYAILKGAHRARRVAVQTYGFVVGSSSIPGPLRALAALLVSPRTALAITRRIPAAWHGRVTGARMAASARRRGPAFVGTIIEGRA